MRYLEDLYDHRSHYDQTKISNYINSDGRARIGCIYISIEKIKGQNNEIEVSLTAATIDMSLLFRDSVSINKWFVELSKELNSIITYIDMEDEGVKMLCFNGTQVDLELRGENHLVDLQTVFFDMVHTFYDRYPHFEK